MSMIVKPYRAQESQIELPKDTNMWAPVITNILMNQFQGMMPQGVSLTFKKLDQERLTAIGTASISINGVDVHFPIIVVGGKMFPLDIAIDAQGNRFPWHPLFISLIPTDQLSTISKRGNDLFASKRLRRKFVHDIVYLKKPAGFKDVLKEACEDPRIMAGLVRNRGKDAMNKMLTRPEVRTVTRKYLIKNATIIPELSKLAGGLSGQTYVLTTDGVKRAVGFNDISGRGRFAVTTDGYIIYEDRAIRSKAEGVKLASDNPAGYGVFYSGTGTNAKAVSPLNVIATMPNGYSCMDNIGNMVLVKRSSGNEASVSGDTITIGKDWKFVAIKDVAQPADRPEYPSGFCRIEKLGMAYLHDGVKFAMGRQEAEQYLSRFYKNADGIIEKIAVAGAVYVDGMRRGEDIPVSCEPLNRDFAKIASIVPSQYSAAALLDVALPIRESVEQMKQHLSIYQTAASALANDVLFSRLSGNPAESDLSVAMYTLCDAALQIVGMLRKAYTEQGK